MPTNGTTTRDSQRQRHLRALRDLDAEVPGHETSYITMKAHAAEATVGDNRDV
jgi:hypothetical protein